MPAGGRPAVRNGATIAPPCRYRRRSMLATAAAAFLLCAPPQGDLAPWIEARLDALVALYHEFHRDPELSYREERTAARFAEQIEQAGLAVTRGVGGHGVVGVLDNGDGPTLLLRADLDALPIAEETGLDYASRNEGAMHACGHDLHMTNLIGAVQYLAAHRDAWRGRLLCIGQPAEERGGGAVAMLRDGLFTRFPRPDFAVALHMHPTLPSDAVGVREGFIMANVDSCDITMLGRGGHGSAPHQAIDPIAQACQLGVELQAIVSREIEPGAPAVVTIGAIHGGTKHNIIPARCSLQLTVRSYTAAVREQLFAAIRRKASAVAQSFGAPEPVVEFSEPVPALCNDAGLAQTVAAALRRELGDERVVPTEPVMGAEDFAYFGREGVPLFMFRLGSVAPARLAQSRAAGEPLPTLHSSRFAPDAPAALRTGIAAMAAAAMELLRR